MTISRRTALLAATCVLACRPAGLPGGALASRASDSLAAPLPLPTGRLLDPVGTSHPVGALPLGTVPLDDGGIALVLSGWGDQGVQLIDRTGRVRQTLVQPAAFVGAATRGAVLFVSGGNTDLVYRYTLAGWQASLADSIVLARKASPKDGGSRYPAGLALSPDGTRLYVAENLADSLAVVDTRSGQVVQRLPAGRYPYAVVVAADGRVFASAWGGHEVHVFRPAGAGRLAADGEIPAGRHPSALQLGAGGARLFVASGSTDRVVVLDTRARRPVAELLDPPPAGPAEGSTPNALALSADGTRLFVAEGDANAVAVFDLSAKTSGIAAATGDDRLAGRIPAEWYPTGVLAFGDTLLVVNGKGRGTRPNPEDGPGPRGSRERRGASNAGYTLAQLTGTVTISTTARAGTAALAPLSARVAAANRWNEPPTPRRGYPPIEHVIYVIKENRTYDQVLGDLPQADGDSGLVYFGRADAPNHHALAERFGIYDRFFVNAEVSADGHNWSTASYTTDYLQKTVQSNYSDRGRDYDYEGTNRGWGPAHVPDDDVNEPAMGYLWDLAKRKGITFRNYGEFVIGEGMEDRPLPAGYRGIKPFLRDHTCDSFPAYDLGVPDQRRVDVWLGEFRRFEREGTLPALEIVRLPNDHTAGLRAGAPTPRAMMADNDLALGRLVEAVSRSRFWASTVIIVLEDDAQNGPDHVDSHRSPLLVISPWAKAGVSHRYANTTDVIRTIEELLGLGSLSQFDHFGRPLREIWRETPDTAPYAALVPRTPLTDTNPREGEGARVSATLDLHIEDAADEDTFNRVLWLGLKGPGVAYPGVRRMSALESMRTR